MDNDVDLENARETIEEIDRGDSLMDDDVKEHMLGLIKYRNRYKEPIRESHKMYGGPGPFEERRIYEENQKSKKYGGPMDR
jgi:hypothetical protein